jgi:hypothetical protein
MRLVRKSSHKVEARRRDIRRLGAQKKASRDILFPQEVSVAHGRANGCPQVAFLGTVAKVGEHFQVRTGTRAGVMPGLGQDPCHWFDRCSSVVPA